MGGKIIGLAHRHFGVQGHPPLIILHGLLGSSRNWATIAQELALHYEVFAVDLRNHGDSPHVEGMGFEDMAQDVVHFMDEHALSKTSLLGHSLGGKVAMRMAVDYPAKVERLIVVDIVPKEYPPHHTQEFAAMNALDLQILTSRKEADALLQQRVPEWAMRQFLLTNLRRGSNGSWGWSIHLQELTHALEDMRRNVLLPGEQFAGPTQFIMGGASHFVQEGDEGLIQQHFPQLQYTTLDNVGHNPHIEAKQAFLDALEQAC